jgi:signal transduction histidine kinase
VPLGLPPHLATRTTSAAVARAGHAAAAVCLVAVGIIAISIQAYLPDLVVWPALVVLVPMIVLLALLERAPSAFIAASYLAIGGLCVFWYTLIASVQLDTPVANDDYSIVLLKIAVILVVGAGPLLGASMLWTTAGLVIGELASWGAHSWLGSAWSIDPTAVTVWFIVIGLLAVLRVDLISSRDAQVELYRAARNEMLAEVRRTYEARATALLHDTVLNQLAVITSNDRELSREVRAAIRSDLALIVGQEWFDVDSQQVSSADVRESRLRAAVDEAAADVVQVDIAVDDAARVALDALDGESFDELSRAIAQCIVNVRRHAGIDIAEVIIGGSSTEISAMVIDAGRGFASERLDSSDATTQPDGRLGVHASIMGRLETVGGSARVWSQPGRGTSVLLRVPVRAEPHGGGAS